jgi:cellulose synthase/poly-beta-1,6-N-acetylglucosamine synthase-like glycosyltransferase
MNSVPCSLGITAHNEETNIGKLLDCILEQELVTVTLVEIIVVISGCTDRTEDIVRDFMTRDRRIRLIVQSHREGKASAINLFLQEAQEEILILSSADLQPTPGTLEALAAPFVDPELGMTACRPIPVNDPQTFMGFAAHLLWDLHHQMNLHGFKAGEMVAFRAIFSRIPQHTAVDEASIEPLIRGQGYETRYIPEAIVYNKGPDNRSDFLRQRRRIYAGHLELKQILGYSVSTMSGVVILSLLLNNLDWRPKQFLWTWGVVAMEISGRVLGWIDFRQHREHTVWEIATTTKELEVES